MNGNCEPLTLNPMPKIDPKLNPKSKTGPEPTPYPRLHSVFVESGYLESISGIFCI